jgi:hypothetical protein
MSNSEWLLRESCVNLTLKSVRRKSVGIGRRQEFKNENWIHETD